jgi:hypothetical protein
MISFVDPAGGAEPCNCTDFASNQGEKLGSYEGMRPIFAFPWKKIAKPSTLQRAKPPMSPRLWSQGFNNTYNQDLFTERAVEIIENHDVSQPLYIYLAYMNVHAGCSGPLGVQAPLSSVAQYAYTELDTYKVRPLLTTAPLCLPPLH